MTAVDIREGVRYGFVLLGYFLVIFVVGGVLVEVGAELLLNFENLLAAVAGTVAILLGLLVLSAGLSGIAYKIIADGVEAGILSAERTTTEGSDLSERSSSGTLTTTIQRSDEENELG